MFCVTLHKGSKDFQITNWPFLVGESVEVSGKLRPWVTGNEAIVKNVNADIPVSLSWFLLPFLAFLCVPASAQFIASSS